MWDVTQVCGWREDQDEVNRIAMKQTIPVFMDGSPKGNEPVLLYNMYREIAGGDDLDVQEIGDCVSWGFRHLVDYCSAVEIYREIHSNPNMTQEAKDALIYEFQDAASEVIYAVSRVEYGHSAGSYQDGSVGAWAAEAIKSGGTLSRAQLEALLGKGKGAYSGRRAREWGAKGLPDELEPAARQHTVATTSLVTNFNDAAHLIENGYGIAVCSNVGFENARRGSQTLRDKQGFATPRGRWNHCMFFCAVRYDRPGLCCINQWPDLAFAGPLDLDQPKNSFWVDERVVDDMLSQRDSWTASNYHGYPLRPLTFRF